MEASVVSRGTSFALFGAITGSRKFESSSVTMITPPAMKMSSSRIGNHSPSAMVYGIVNINDSVMVPLAPPKVITAAERQRSGVMRRRLCESCARARRSMPETHRNRRPTMSVETHRMTASSV